MGRAWSAKNSDPCEGFIDGMLQPPSYPASWIGLVWIWQPFLVTALSRFVFGTNVWARVIGIIKSFRNEDKPPSYVQPICKSKMDQLHWDYHSMAAGRHGYQWCADRYLILPWQPSSSHSEERSQYLLQTTSWHHWCWAWGLGAAKQSTRSYYMYRAMGFSISVINCQTIL